MMRIIHMNIQVSNFTNKEGYEYHRISRARIHCFCPRQGMLELILVEQASSSMSVNDARKPSVECAMTHGIFTSPFVTQLLWSLDVVKL